MRKYMRSYFLAGVKGQGEAGQQLLLAWDGHGQLLAALRDDEGEAFDGFNRVVA